jgi:membrane-bound lytic murein transglycosylase D
LLLALAAIYWTAGCAAPLSHPPPGDLSDDLSAEPIPADPLAAAREAYFQGVRAYVAEDRNEAWERFERCRHWLLLVEGAEEGASDEAGILATKADYFLAKIEEENEAESPLLPEESGSEAAEPLTWESISGPIAPKRNPDVDRWLAYFEGDGREVFQRWLDRQARFQPTFDEVLQKHKLPRELTFHAMIESGFSTSAYSWAHAVGLWQFIRSTGQKYGLRCDWWVDERRDPAKSTDAAARYLSDLYEEFQDWELALAAYNVGEMRVRSQIKSQKTRDFWSLKLPRETRNHIPKFYAALILGSDPEAHGFTVAQAAHPATETIQVDFSVDFEVLGESCGGVPAATLAELNPALVRRATPPDDGGYPVVVPAGTGETAAAALAAIPAEKRIRWAHYRVQRGDTLSEIADRHRTSVQAVAEANRLKSMNRLRVGQDLLIPQGTHGAPSAPRVAAADPAPSSRGRVTYVVLRGDTLSEIAEKHGTSASALRSWNRLGQHIYPGQRLTIWQGVAAPEVASAVAASSSGSDTVIQVRAGDTLWDIARAHGVSLTSLLHANGLTTKSRIRPGDRIKVPKS